MAKHVYVLVRYSVLSEGSGAWVLSKSNSLDDYKKSLFAKKRLDLHQEIFFKVTLPSLKKMDSAHTTVLVFTSKELPEKYMKALIDEASKYENIKIIPLPVKGSVTTQMHECLEEELKVFEEDLCYATVRLDDDDALSKYFYKEVKKYLSKGFAGYAISFPKGVAGIYEDGVYKSFHRIKRPKIAMGLTYVNFYSNGHRLKKPESVFALGNHTKVDRKHPLIIDSGREMFMRTVHVESDIYSEELKDGLSQSPDVKNSFSISAF